jgi:hypothetical protein
MQGMLESGVPQPAKRGTPGDFFRTSVFQYFADTMSVWFLEQFDSFDGVACGHEEDG